LKVARVGAHKFAGQQKKTRHVTINADVGANTECRKGKE